MAFDQLLKKNFWIVILPMVGIAALLNAQAVTQLIGIGIGADEKQLSAPPPGAKVASVTTTTTRTLSAEKIIDRNPFDHATGSLRPPPSETTETPVADLTDPASAPLCDGLKVTVVLHSADPDWSMATLSGSDGKAVLRRRGGEIGGKKVTFVGRDRVWLEGGGSLCQALLFKPSETAPKPAAAPVPEAPAASATAKSGAPALDPSIAKGIQKLSASEYNIDRGVVDKILENQADLMRQARIVPEQENGRVVGIRLFGVRPDTLLGVLGMENGDRLQTINGFDMSSPEKALEAYARLRTADKLTVQVNRRGQNMNLDYHIR